MICPRITVDIITRTLELTCLRYKQSTLRFFQDESESVLSSRLKEVNDQLMRYEAENKNLSNKLQQTEQDLTKTTELMTQTSAEPKEAPEVTEMRQKLTDAEQEVATLKSSLETAEGKVRQYEAVEAQNSELLKVG